MDTAARWWLGSSHNSSRDSNDYTRVNFYGNRDKYPWKNPDGAAFIANELRACRFAGLGLSWTGPVPWECNQLHVVTAWGDSGDENGYGEGESPGQIIIADSDNELLQADSDLRAYSYDDYSTPSTPNSGEGWYLLDYDVYPAHPYIQNLTTLGRADTTFQDAVTVTGSYRIFQDGTETATGLHYIVGSMEDYRILDYETWISLPESGQPEIVELGDPATKLEVEWDSLTATPGTPVLINTEFVLPDENVLCYEDLYFIYGEDSLGSIKSSFQWKIDSYQNYDTLACGLCGGHIVGGFEVFSDLLCTGLIGEYRLSHEYTFRQDPELHDFTLSGSDTLYISNLRFGHCYGKPGTDSLWDFSGWIESFPGTLLVTAEDSVALNLDWEGMLPYPELCVTDAEPIGTTPNLAIDSAYPNPFNPSVEIHYSVGYPSAVELSVYDISGRRVAVLYSGYRKEGRYRAVWDGKNSNGMNAASGIYFISLGSGRTVASSKIVLLR